MARRKSLPAFAAGPNTRRHAPARPAPLRTAAVDDFSYAEPSDPWTRRALIRAIERSTGQPRLRAMYRDYTSDPTQFPSFWDAAVHYLNLDLDIGGAGLDAIPAEGPVVVVANHPYGIVDGLLAGYVLSRVRQDFRILTHSLLSRAPELNDFLLPIDFSDTSEALATNIATRRAALSFLAGGGCVVIFPAGGVSTTPGPFARQAIDSDWKSFVGRLVHQSGAAVVPMFFPGQNSRAFQIASHVNQTLRLALLFHETHRRIGARISLRIGAPIAPETLTTLPNRKAIVAALREATYALGTEPDMQSQRR